MTPRAPVTLADVARRAGVSLSTASRAVNGSRRQVTPQLEQRVAVAAAELGYTPNAQAQALARSASRVVGLVVHDIADPYFASIAAGAIQVADQRELIVMLGTTFRDPQREVECASMLRVQRVRAILMVGTRTSSRAMTARLAAELEAFEAAGGRVACVSQPRLPFDMVVPENRAGARDLARELVRLGHREFAAVAAPRSLLVSRDRLAGFREGLAEHGLSLPEDKIAEGAMTRDGGYSATGELLDRKIVSTCIFAVSDVMAIGTMAALRKHRIPVPGKVSVAGFDDIPSVGDLTPPITTVRLPLAQMGAQAAELALDPDRDRSARVVRFPGQVVIRESTRDLRRPSSAPAR